MKIHERSPQSRPSNCAMKSVIDGIIDRAVLPLKDEIRNYMAKCHENDREDRENDKKKDYELPRTVTNEGT